MSQQSRLAVEVTRGEDFINIWVDANNNGVRDDDDVNIFVSSSGSLFAESPTFKQTLDAHIKQRLKEASLAFMQAGHDPAAEESICDLALELVVKACSEPAPAPEALAAPQHAPHTAAQEAWQSNEHAYAQWAAQAPAAPEATTEYSEQGIPVYRPQ